MFDYLRNGFLAPDLALTIERVTVGVFFAISGYHKLFNPARHASLVQTLKVDRIPFVRFNEWFVPGVELLAGVALTIGFLSVWSALLLGAICLVATCMDGVGRITERFHPIDRADWLDDLLYLPEVLYGIMLLTVVLAGPTAYSVDALVWK